MARLPYVCAAVIGLLAAVPAGAEEQGDVTQIAKKPPITSVLLWPDRPPVTHLTPYLLTRLSCNKKFHDSWIDGTWDGRSFEQFVRACIAAGG